MIRRLRLKFICVNMAIVLVMMALMTVAVLYFTQRSLARESLHAMQQIAMDPLRPQAPGKAADGVRLPYFVLEVDETGAVHAAGGGYYDLSDTGFLAQAAAQIEAEGAQSGILRAYGRGFCGQRRRTGKFIVFADMSHRAQHIKRPSAHLPAHFAGRRPGFLAISTLLAHLAVRPVEEAWAQQKQFVAECLARAENAADGSAGQCRADVRRGPAPHASSRRWRAAPWRPRGGCAALWKSCWSWHGADGRRAGAPRGTRLDWAQETNEALLPFEPLCFEKGLVLDTRLDAGIFVRGDAALLRQLAAILLDNACKYSSPGTVVRVVLKRRGKRRAVLSVANWGQPSPRKSLRISSSAFTAWTPPEAKARAMAWAFPLRSKLSAGTAEKFGPKAKTGKTPFTQSCPAL